MDFKITMMDGTSVGEPQAKITEIEMSRGRITGIHIWPLEGDPYWMRIPDQNQIAKISHRPGSEPESPEVTIETAKLLKDLDKAVDAYLSSARGSRGGH